MLYTLKPGKENFYAVDDFLDRYNIERLQLINRILSSLDAYDEYAEDDTEAVDTFEPFIKNNFTLINWNNSDGLAMQIETHDEKMQFMLEHIVGQHLEC